MEGLLPTSAWTLSCKRPQVWESSAGRCGKFRWKQRRCWVGSQLAWPTPGHRGHLAILERCATSRGMLWPVPAGMLAMRRLPRAPLTSAEDFIDQVIALQRSWMALEPIFASDDIKRQLPQESESFARIDSNFRMRMARVDSNKNCIAISKIENIVEDMTEANTTIEKVQKGLKDYLETKRLYFPRFFFLNDADLLSILAETKDPTLVQPHLNKAFEGIAKVRFDSKCAGTKMQAAPKLLCLRCPARVAEQCAGPAAPCVPGASQAAQRGFSGLHLLKDLAKHAGVAEVAS
ncbi:unnamed protein product [Effrenium voratum]|uniref:Dynein heavy chain linker domain-containing protein n=1 Tax=Effrenium voratum TaxID=2562239 RepID=A0AA36IN36_9DINO|nr:unnamed protein product [Effrenium voratum]